MFCKECGSEIKNEAKFCPKCGTPVKQPKTPDGAASAACGNGGQQGDKPQAKWPKRRRVVVAVVAAVVVIVAALAVAVGVSMPSDKEVEAAKDMLAVDAGVDAASAPYVDEAGYVDASNVKDAVKAVEKQVRAQAGNAVVQCVNDGDSVTFVLSSGIHYIYAPTVKGQLGGEAAEGGETAEEAAPAEAAPAEGQDAEEEKRPELSVVTFEPYRSAFDEAGLRSITEEKESLCEAEGFKAGEDYADGEVSVETLESKLGKNQMVLWFGHGLSTSLDGSVLPTGTTVVDATSNVPNISMWIVWRVLEQDGLLEKECASVVSWISATSKYKDDLENARLVVVKTNEDNGRLAMTSRFIEEHYDEGDLAGSAFYFGTCEMLKDVCDPVEGVTPFAQALVNAGASYVSGYTGTVPTSFEEQTRISLVNNLKSGTDLGIAFVNTKSGADGSKRAQVSKGEEKAEPIGKEKYADTYFSYIPLAKGQEHKPAIERPEDKEEAAEEEKPAEDSDKKIEDERSEEAEDLGSAQGEVTWYEGAYGGAAPAPYITSVRVEGNTLVIKGALMHASSESALKGLNPFADPDVVDEEQTYRFKLTSSTKIEQVTSSEKGTTERLTLKEFKALSLPAAPGNIYSVDANGSLLSIWMGV